MWLDNTVTFSSAQSIATSATTTLVSTTTYDVTGAGVGVASGMITGVNGSTGATQPVGFDIGAGDGMAIPEVYWNFPAGVNAASTGTLQLQIQAAADNGSNQPLTWYTIAQTSAMTTTDLVINANGQIQVPPVPFNFGESMPRFYRLAYVIATSTFSAGTISANLVLNPSQPTKLQNYPGNYTA